MENNGFTNTSIQHENDFITGYFPDDFVWAVATASYQIEGAWQEDGMSIALRYKMIGMFFFTLEKQKKINRM